MEGDSRALTDPTRHPHTLSSLEKAAAFRVKRWNRGEWNLS